MFSLTPYNRSSYPQQPLAPSSPGSPLPVSEPQKPENGQPGWDLLVLAAIKTVGTALVEHPLDRCKTAAQQYPALRSSQIVDQIWRNEGWKGFLDGAGAVLVKDLARQSYRLPAMYTFGSILNQAAMDSPYAQQITNVGLGIGMAATDALTIVTLAEKLKIGMMTAKGEFAKTDTAQGIAPSEKFKVGIMTAQGDFTKITPPPEMKHYWRAIKREWRENGLPGLYKGGVTTFAVQTGKWETFFWAYNTLDSWCRKNGWYQTHPLTAHAFVNAGTTAIVTVVVFPIDRIKTLLQTPGMQHETFWNVLRTAVRTNGLGSLFAGAGFMLARGFIDTSLSAPVFSRVLGKPKES